MPQINQPQETCPICSSLIEEYLINLETRMSMCENVKCTYPFNKSNPKEFIVKATGSTNNDNKYSNSSSNIKNSTNECGPMKGKKRTKPIQDHPTHKSVNGKKQETTYSLTSPIKQKDTPLVLALPSKTISTGSVLTTTPRSSGTSTFTQDTHPSKRFRPSQSTAAPTPVSRPPPTPTKPTSTIVNPQAPTQSTKETNNTTSISTNCNYTLADIEFLLNDQDEDNGSTVVTPKEDSVGAMNPMIWLDDIFQGQDHGNVNTKCNPLQTDQDLDSLLGLSLFQ